MTYYKILYLNSPIAISPFGASALHLKCQKLEANLVKLACFVDGLAFSTSNWSRARVHIWIQIFMIHTNLGGDSKHRPSPSFLSFRHWKATREYHKTRDLIHVQEVFGHADIKSTMAYINLEKALFNAQLARARHRQVRTQA